METTDLQPIKPRNPRVRVEQSGDELLLADKARRSGPAVFLGLWLTGWTVGCVFLVGEAIAEPSLEIILFAVPFVASWFAVFAILVGMLVGRQTLRLNREGLVHEQRALLRVSRRTIGPHELRRAVAAKNSRDSDNGPTLLLRIESLGRDLDFASGLTDKEQRWLVELVNRQLDSLGLLTAAPELPQTLRLARLPLEPPSDSSYQLVQDFASQSFVARGGWSLAAIFGSAFIVLFWDGAVGVFILQLVKQFEWGLCLFLIPFEAIGLAMLLPLLYTLTAPAWSQSWTLRRDGLDWRYGGFGIGRTKRTEISALDRIELHPAEDGDWRGALLRLNGLSADTGKFSLSLVAPGQEEVLSINSLTEGEARWIADTVLRTCPEWFRALEARR